MHSFSPSSLFLQQSKTAFTIYSDDAENQPPPGAFKAASSSAAFKPASVTAPTIGAVSAKSSNALIKPTSQSQLAAPAPKQAVAAAASSKVPAPARGFKNFENKENAIAKPASTTELAKESAKGLSSRAQDAVLSTFNAQQSARNIPRAFQLKEQELDMVRRQFRRAFGRHSDIEL